MCSIGVVGCVSPGYLIIMTAVLCPVIRFIRIVWVNPICVCVCVCGPTAVPLSAGCCAEG